MELREVTYLAIILRIFFAVLMGGIIGIDRGLKNRPAGLRTYMVVCLGACLIMLTNQYVCQVHQTGDPVRMGAQVVSGIGFLGAGTIIVTKRSQIKGLTTAAGLWAAAGVGLALGVGFYEAAIVGGLAILAVMTFLQRMDAKMHRRSRVMELYVELNSSITLGGFLKEIRKNELEVRDTQREGEIKGDIRSYIFTVKMNKNKNHVEVVDDINRLPGVAYAEEL